MKKIKKMLAGALCIGLFAIGAGCKSTSLPMQKALYVTTVSTGVAFGVEKYPTALPYLRVAEPIICAAGNGTNITPAEIVAALQNSPAANAVATREGKVIMNGVIAIYIGVFESYGTDYVAHHEQLSNYLKWTCEAMGMGLPQTNAASAMRRKPLPPHL